MIQYLENDKGQKCLPVADILLDTEFNHRGHVSIGSVSQLAASIKNTKGLLQPIIVRPIDHPEYKWQVVGGHRRLTAYRAMKVANIPVVIQDKMNEFEAKTVSAVENLQNKELNVMQEARSIRHLWAANWSRGKIAEEVNMSPGWVQIRTLLLEMPKEVQDVADSGYLTQSDIRTISKYDRDEQIKAARQLKEKRRDGLKARLTVPQTRTTKRQRKPAEINRMNEYLRGVLLEIDMAVEVAASDLISLTGNCFATSMGAWCAGYINNYEFHKRLQSFCETLGHEYVIPVFDENLEAHHG